MPATISAIIDIVRARTDHTGLTDGEMLDLLNDGQRRILRQYPFIFQETRVTGTLAFANPQTFPLPSDFQTPLWFFVYAPSGVTVTVEPIDYFHGLQAYASASTKTYPDKWAIYGTVGYLYPALNANTDYAFYYHKQLGDFATVTGTNALLVQAPEVLSYMGVAEHYTALGELKLSAAAQARAVDAVKALIKQSIRMRENHLSAIPSSPGSLRRR